MTEGGQQLRVRVSNLGDAFTDLLDQEFDWSAGHLATILSGCAFAPSILTFWLVNGVLDFSTAFVIGSVGGPGGLMLRLLAYLLLVPAFLSLRITYYLAHPVHRRAVLSGGCPQSKLLSLDWFSVGILTTGLPLALESIGPWLGMNTVFLVGLFGLPRLMTTRWLELGTKSLALALGTVVFLYANYGQMLATAVPLVPEPATILGPVATLVLSERTVELLLHGMNSILVGPLAVALVAFFMNRLLTRPELTSVPYFRHSLPERDPAQTVVVSAALGTVFYLTVVAVFGGTLILVP